MPCVEIKIIEGELSKEETREAYCGCDRCFRLVFGREYA